MTVLEGVLLGIVQGLTEFLPVSSSGHLALARNFMQVGSVPLLFDVVLHVATLLVIVYHYRMRILRLLSVGVRFIMRKSDPSDREDLHMILLVIGATVLTVIVALVLRKIGLGGDSTRSVSILLLVTAALLASTPFVERLVPQKKNHTWIQAVVTGIAQGFGTLAGISRSGITITASLWTGMSREKSGEYAFILFIPAVLGALILTVVEEGRSAAHVGFLPTAVGFVVSFIVGLASLRLLLWMVRRAKLWYFTVYLTAVGLFGLFLTV